MTGHRVDTSRLEGLQPAGKRGGAWLVGARAMIGVSALLVATGVALSAVQAVAVLHEVAESGSPGMLHLRADAVSPSWRMAPGDREYWHVEARLEDAPSGALELELRAEGALVTVAGMTAEVVSCRSAFVATQSDPMHCPDGAATVLAETPLAELAMPGSGAVFPLAELHRGQPRHLLVTVGLPADAATGAVDGASATVGVGLHARGDGPESPEAPRMGMLPPTGTDLAALAVLAIGMLGIAVGVVLRRRSSAPDRLRDGDGDGDGGGAR